MENEQVQQVETMKARRTLQPPSGAKQSEKNKNLWGRTVTPGPVAINLH